MVIVFIIFLGGKYWTNTFIQWLPILDKHAPLPTPCPTPQSLLKSDCCNWYKIVTMTLLAWFVFFYAVHIFPENDQQFPKNRQTPVWQASDTTSHCCRPVYILYGLYKYWIFQSENTKGIKSNKTEKTRRRRKYNIERHSNHTVWPWPHFSGNWTKGYIDTPAIHVQPGIDQS